MTELDWFSCSEPLRLLAFLQGKSSDRKRWLFAVAALRSVWSSLRDERSRIALRAVERFADRGIAEAELQTAAEAAKAAANELERAYADIKQRCMATIDRCGDMLAFPNDLMPNEAIEAKAQYEQASDEKTRESDICYLAGKVQHVAQLAAEYASGQREIRQSLASVPELLARAESASSDDEETEESGWGPALTREDLQHDAKFALLKAEWLAEQLAKSATLAAESVVQVSLDLDLFPIQEEFHAAMAVRLRDIFGNPNDPVRLNPRMRTRHVVELARAAYDDRDDCGVLSRQRIAAVAAALEQAQCRDQRLLIHLAHLREELPHVRGCWALDLILDQE